MASYTPNLNLILPVGTEKVSRQIVNQNNEIIDSAVGNIVAPTVQGVSTLAELKTYLLAVAGSAEARKNVPVQFNLTAAASPFNSGLYTGIMQKETNGAFSVLCHGYNGGVVEVQYASSTWTIMNMTSEISSLNGNIAQLKHNRVGISVDITSYDQSNKYIAPNDGYVRVSTGTTVGDIIAAEVESIDIFARCNNAGTTEYNSLFVRKGMRIATYANTGLRGVTRYYPLSSSAT